MGDVQGSFGIACIRAGSADICEGLTSVSQQLVLDTFWDIYCWDYVQLINNKSTVKTLSERSDHLLYSTPSLGVSESPFCTVLCRDLNMHLWSILLAEKSSSLIGVSGCDSWWGSLLLCRCHIEGKIFWDRSDWVEWLHIPNLKIVKNPSSVMLHWTFTMYWPKVYSISQWWNLCKR